MKVLFNRFFGILVAIGTAFVFLWFTHMRPEIVNDLKRANVFTVFLIVFVYAGSIYSLSFILHEMLRLYGRNLPYSENLLLTAYSSLVNFFGPGQSGPGVRAVYLNVKHDIAFNHFLFGTSIYFAWLILFSSAMLVAPRTPWWLAMVYVATAAAVFVLLIWLVAGPNKNAFVPGECKSRLVRMILMTGIGTALQISFIATAYFTELRTVDPCVTLSQAISFTGAANFSLFVSITPGAIGIREAFLFFSQDIHGVSVETIAAASALDRAIYLVVLALLGLLVLFTHADQRFRQTNEVLSQDNP